MIRQNGLLQENVHDPCIVKQRYRDPSVREKCNVVFRNGAFEWVKKFHPESDKYARVFRKREGI